VKNVIIPGALQYRKSIAFCLTSLAGLNTNRGGQLWKEDVETLKSFFTSCGKQLEEQRSSSFVASIPYLSRVYCPQF